MPQIRQLAKLTSANSESACVGFNWILTRHIDFVLCDKPQQRPLLGIELNDSSHTKYDLGRESDEFKKSVFKQVGLPLLPFDVKAYNENEVINQIREVLVSRSVPENTERSKPARSAMPW